ncbi:predicted protein [Uncinocarpus reesii 1704]|uniref:Histone transcription regulator 3 homolog n=1 Tax=Uncinocarpus reesii (strain UAMH 1704) TaxID=336963 RepID=C4JYL2_UNCRE|nr:uncharacterized protein UREG_07263 [Uncinocarpus reesii 1704]EEP82398.1 predicted protein [Uncinocarpus reesii 1704]
MSSFVALNVEPDEDLEELDDTKEIQIEEALKLYQNALKLHSQGPEFYDQAQDAYNALFESEIFKYPEAVSEYKRDQLLDLDDEDPYSWDEVVEGDTAPDALNTTSSALPQTVFLSYKNHAQFLLDFFKRTLDQGHTRGGGYATNQIKEALGDFAEALERDDTDLELWRKTSRVGSALRSHRIARFCLESVLEGNTYGLDGQLGQLGLEHVFALKALRQILSTLHDKLSFIRLPVQQPRKGLSILLAKQADSFPFLPDYSKEITPCSTFGLKDGQFQYRFVEPLSETWSDVGDALLRVLREDSEADSPSWPSVILRIQAPTHNSVELPYKLPVIQRDTSDGPVDTQSNIDHDIDVPDADSEHTAVVAENADTEATRPEAESINELAIEEPADKTIKDVTTADPEPGDSVMQDIDKVPTSPLDEPNVKINAPQSRKRSSTSAANEEPTDGGRAKSRRIRARESIAEAQAQQDDVFYDQTKYFEDRLEQFAHADQWMFSTTGALLSKLGVEEFGTIDELKHIMDRVDGHMSPRDFSQEGKLETVSMRDLREAIGTWAGIQSLKDDIFTSHDGLSGLKQSGLDIFLERSRQNPRTSYQSQCDPDDEGLSLFLQSTNLSYFHPQHVAFNWLEHHLTSKSASGAGSNFPRFQPNSTYASRHWPDQMKTSVKSLIIVNDEFMYRKLLSSTSCLDIPITPKSSFENDRTSVADGLSLAEMAQSLYELHLDMYASMTSPNSEADEASKTLQRDRLRRWGSVARIFINHQQNVVDNGDFQTGVILRHLWSTILHFNITDDAEREYVLVCLEDLKRVLKLLDEPVIALVNNPTMPELSLSAVEQEIARISSMDFFMKVFGPGNEDPVSLIESIEPILDPSAIEHLPPGLGENGLANSSNVSSQIQRARDLAFFLDRGDATLKLLLWRRLQKAYESIQYPTKVISCSLKSIEIIVAELQAPTYLDLPSEQRRETLLKWLNRADYLMLNVIGKVLDDPKSSFECIDMNHLQSSMSAIAQLSKLLHSFVLYEDSVRIGQINPPEVRPATAAKAYDHYKEKVRSMVVRAWTLQYALIKEGIAQNKELFDMPADDCINYLRSVHSAFGIRSYCRCANKVLLKVMKHELLTLEAEDSYESDIAQVLFDYHGLKFSSELDISLEHGCPVEKLDRSTALMLVDFAMLQANRMNIKDFLKSDLKSTIDTIQTSIGWSGRIHTTITQNKRILSAFLKSPINPSALYRAVRGVNQVSVVPAYTESCRLAKSGWYFLLGLAAFTKFKTQKRVGPIATDDLDLAATFFRRELEHGIERWETWYRLGQVYDSKLEEDITWSAEKLNHHRADLASLERRAIHSYAMAVAIAIRTADSSPETRKTISDMYTQFGFRIYASSREPFSMGAFSLDDFTRHFSSGQSRQMYTGPPFRDMKLYAAWHFASYLFRKAMADQPTNWVNHYMFSKCLWKMFTSEDPLKESYEPVQVDDILDSLDAAIASLPTRRESRSDPIFEPHFKLISVIHKLVMRGDLKPYDASKKLVVTPWAKMLSPVKDLDTWKSFITTILKNLQIADKSNWHHRIIARAVHIIYDDTKDDQAAAQAKHQLSQHVLTKTMTLQIWKPENERPGRHFVYTSRYLYFIVRIIDQLDDRTSLDLLLRRVRRRPNDYVNYTKLWEDICTTYIKLFRRVGNVPTSHEETVFKPLGHDEFVTNAAHLDSWTQTGKADPKLMDLVREAVELKKLNGGLIKPGMFEDLVGDVYALLYENTVPRILEGIATEENRERMKVDHLLSAGDAADRSRTPPPSTFDKQSEKPSEKGPGPKPRAKGVTRREIQRKADAIATKLAVSRLAAKASRLAEEELRAPAEDSTTEKPINEDEEEISKPVTGDLLVSDAPIVPSSAVPSIHDGGDEESELSELDESKLSEPTKQAIPTFPSLHVRRLASPNPLSELSSNVSHDGKEPEGVEHMELDPSAGGGGEGDGDGEEDGEDDGGDGDGDSDGDSAGGNDNDDDGDSPNTISPQDNVSEEEGADKKSEPVDEIPQSDRSDLEMEGPQ